MKIYTVTLRFQYPAWDERNGLTYEGIEAKTKADAIKQARRQAEYDGNAGSGCKHGLEWFKAVETGEVGS
jgi:hypothetical protein